MGLMELANKKTLINLVNKADNNTKEGAIEFYNKYGKEGVIILTKVWCADKIYTKCRRCQMTWNKYKKAQEEDFLSLIHI